MVSDVDVLNDRQFVEVEPNRRPWPASDPSSTRPALAGDVSEGAISPLFRYRFLSTEIVHLHKGPAPPRPWLYSLQAQQKTVAVIILSDGPR